MVGVDLQHLLALGRALGAGHGGENLLHLQGQGPFAGQAHRVALQPGGQAHRLHLARQRLLHGVEQGLVGLGLFLGGLLLLLGLQAEVPGRDVLEFLLRVLLAVAAQHLQAEFVHVLGEQQHVEALVQHQLGGGQLGQPVGGIAGGVVDELLVRAHLFHILRQGDHLLLPGAVKQQQVLQLVGVHAVVGVAAVFQLTAEVLEERLVLLPLASFHGVQLVLDLLFKA